jgi:predicted transposase YbfD/YdcC
VFTADAMHCQKTFETAKDTGSFLVAQVKANQQEGDRVKEVRDKGPRC